MIRRVFRALWGTISTVRGAIANLLFLAILAIIIAALLDRPAPLPDRAALRLDLAGSVVDQRTRVSTGSVLFGDAGANREMLLTDLIDAVELARDDERIVALVMELDGLLRIGQSKTTELAEALERFRATGKPIVAVADYYTQDQYRLAVEADTVIMHPFGAVAIEGFGYFINYFAEALEKLLVTVHVFRAGDFKSIAEPYLRSDMSPGEREVSQRWLGDLWAAYGEAIEARRGLPQGHLGALLADYPERLRAADGDPARLASSEGLVDQLLDRQQRDAYLEALVGVTGGDGRYEGIAFEEYLSRSRGMSLRAGEESVAVVVAQGNIVPGRQGLGAIGAESLVETLRRAVDRNGVRALVLRVTSGGGSVFASEIIRAELMRIREEEAIPIVVSMGSVAASGGYYIATAADRIMATPTTLTGSIGVFAAFPTFERLLEKGGIHTDGVGTTPLAGGLRPDRALSPLIEDAVQQGVDYRYEQFLDLVATSRDLDRGTLDSVAEGRVLSSLQAEVAGLIYAIGSLDDAVDLAGELAGLSPGSFRVITVKPSIPPRDVFLQQLSDIFAVDTRLVTLLAALWPAAAVNEFMATPDPHQLYMRCLVCEAAY
ncbi:MAG: signal peptide peptidase SppA [Pseudomonadota bacterium]